MDNRSLKFLWLLIIIDYQYQPITDGNRSINIIDCCQYAISIDYLFSQTFQLPISSSTNKVTHYTLTIRLIVFERRLRPRSIEAKSIKFVHWQWDMLIVLIICAVFHGATSMNNSQTLLLRFKNNVRSVYNPAIPEDTETWIVPINGNR